MIPGPASGNKDEEELRKLEKDKKAFGSHDIQSHQVISNLKKAMALEKKAEEVGDESSSLDFSSLDRPVGRKVRFVIRDLT